MVYPWRTATEWRAVRELLFSSDRVAEGLQHVAMWETRAALPHAVSATSELLSARDRLGIACAVIRLVNGLTDPLQSTKARNLRGIAVDELGLHPLLVDVRHESTHGVLPSLKTLERCKKEALEWLWNNYWRGKNRAAAEGDKDGDPVAKLRGGELAPWQQLSKRVRVDERTVDRLVSWRRGRDEEEEKNAEEIAEELKVASLPKVPRWTEGEGGGTIEREAVRAVAAKISF